MRPLDLLLSEKQSLYFISVQAWTMSFSILPVDCREGWTQKVRMQGDKKNGFNALSGARVYHGLPFKTPGGSHARLGGWVPPPPARRKTPWGDATKIRLSEGIPKKVFAASCRNP